MKGCTCFTMVNSCSYFQFSQQMIKKWSLAQHFTSDTSVQTEIMPKTYESCFCQLTYNDTLWGKMIHYSRKRWDNCEADSEATNNPRRVNVFQVLTVAFIWGSYLFQYGQTHVLTAGMCQSPLSQWPTNCSDVITRGVLVSSKYETAGFSCKTSFFLKSHALLYMDDLSWHTKNCHLADSSITE